MSAARRAARLKRRRALADLVYDIGMHDGDDSDFYLRKGFRVVAVEADPDVCRETARRFPDALAAGQLTIVNRAIAPTRGPVTLHRSQTPGWSTIVDRSLQALRARDVPTAAVMVSGTTLADLTAEYGEPLYMKLDIEGMDRCALQSLATTTVRPRYLSMETSFSTDPSYAAVKADFDLLARLGYDRFKIIDQRAVPLQVAPDPPHHGRHVPANFLSGASGLFGEESPGPWLSQSAALRQFRRHMRRKSLDIFLYRNMRLYMLYNKIRFRLTGRYSNLGWYDIHAKHSSID